MTLTYKFAEALKTELAKQGVRVEFSALHIAVRNLTTEIVSVSEMDKAMWDSFTDGIRENIDEMQRMEMNRSLGGLYNSCNTETERTVVEKQDIDGMFYRNIRWSRNMLFIKKDI